MAINLAVTEAIESINEAESRFNFSSRAGLFDEAREMAWSFETNEDRASVLWVLAKAVYIAGWVSSVWRDVYEMFPPVEIREMKN